MDFISKFKFLQKKLPVVIITGEKKKVISGIVGDLLKNRFKIGEEISIFESNLEHIRNLELFLRTSQKPLLIISGIGNVPEQNLESVLTFIKSLTDKVNIILDFDNVEKRIGHFPNLNVLTFGFEEGADFRVSDVKSNGGTNFKINYQGKVIPFWLKKAIQKEEIYPVVCAVLVATVLGLNLVEISQTIRER